jgi:hypothetical protein
MFSLLLLLQVRLVPEGGDDASQPYLLGDAYAARPLAFTRKVRGCMPWAAAHA